MSNNAETANNGNPIAEGSVGDVGIDSVPELRSLHWWERVVDGVAAWPRTLLLIGIGLQLSVLLGMIGFARRRTCWARPCCCGLCPSIRATCFAATMSH